MPSDEAMAAAREIRSEQPADWDDGDVEYVAEIIDKHLRPSPASSSELAKRLRKASETGWVTPELIDETAHRIAELEAERDRLAAIVEEKLKWPKKARCAYCEDVQEITSIEHWREVADKHVAECPGHPMRELEAERMACFERLRLIASKHPAALTDTDIAELRVFLECQGKARGHGSFATDLGVLRSRVGDLEYRVGRLLAEIAIYSSLANHGREILKSGGGLARVDELLRRIDEREHDLSDKTPALDDPMLALCPSSVESATTIWESSGVEDHCAGCGCTRAEHETVSLSVVLAARDAEVESLREALDYIRVYGSDTLSGPTDHHPCHHALLSGWYREGLSEIVRRARAALKPAAAKEHATAFDNAVEAKPSRPR